MIRPLGVMSSGLAAVAATSAFGATPVVGGIDTFVAVGTLAPDAPTRIVDDTGTIAVSLPESWTVETAPETRSGLEFPRIVAQANDTMIVTISAHVYDEDLESTVCGAWWLQGDCEPYDDGNLAGFGTTTEECCGGSGRAVVLTANPVDGERVTAHVGVSYTAGQEVEAGIFPEIVASVELLDSPYPDDWQLSASALAPPQVPSGQSFWPYPDFTSVPRLGVEPSLGSGCGANGQIGDVIPDGLWAGSLTFITEENRWDVNLMCVYSGAAADDVLAGGANVVAGDRDYLVVDSNPRLRSVPNQAAEVTTTFADIRTGDRCVPGVTQPMPFDNSQVPGSQAWIRVHDGAVTWVVFGCDAGFYGPGG